MRLALREGRRADCARAQEGSRRGGGKGKAHGDHRT